jgi:precorrin-6Y C5,15-methyltransferase (decarboxylating)
VIGIGGDGWAGLTASARLQVESAAVVIGGRRHLGMLPTVPGQRREPWPSPLRQALPAFLAGLGDGPVVALASGDPLVSGIGTTLVDVVGADRVVVEPATSSVALARARMCWSAEGCTVVSLVGRDPHLVLRELAPGRRILALSSDETTPAVVARLLSEAGYGESRLTVLGDLGAPAESRRDGRAATWAGPAPRLNILAIEAHGARGAGWVAGLPDAAFEHDGQLTKRDLRASALARLAPAPGEHLWDVGAGAGSVAIEWMRAHPTCTATAIEADAARSARIGRNAARLGVPDLDVVLGRAPDALADLPAPDAIFVGGGATRAGVVDACLAALRPGGRLVVHGVTLETEQLLASLYREHGGELTRISVEAAAPIGSFTGWTPARAVTQWALGA